MSDAPATPMTGRKQKEEARTSDPPGYLRAYEIQNTETNEHEATGTSSAQVRRFEAARVSSRRRCTNRNEPAVRKKGTSRRQGYRLGDGAQPTAPPCRRLCEFRAARAGPEVARARRAGQRSARSSRRRAAPSFRLLPSAKARRPSGRRISSRDRNTASCSSLS